MARFLCWDHEQQRDEREVDGYDAAMAAAEYLEVKDNQSGDGATSECFVWVVEVGQPREQATLFCVGSELTVRYFADRAHLFTCAECKQEHGCASCRDEAAEHLCERCQSRRRARAHLAEQSAKGAA